MTENNKIYRHFDLLSHGTIVQAVWRRSSTETVAPIMFPVERKKRICQKCQKSRNNLRNYLQQRSITQVFRDAMCSLSRPYLNNEEKRFSFRRIQKDFLNVIMTEVLTNYFTTVNA